MSYIGAIEEWTKQGLFNSETGGVKSADMSMALVQYPECGLEGEDFWKTQLLNDSILSRLSMITVKEITPHSTEVALTTKVHGKGVVSTTTF